MKNNSDLKFILFVFLILILLIGGFFGFKYAVGTGGWGPKNYVEAVVLRTYVDHDKEGSHYMVGTSEGVFEVQNGWIIGVWNADDLFSRMKEGQKLALTTKGRRWANWFMQEYPYIVEASSL